MHLPNLHQKRTSHLSEFISKKTDSSCFSDWFCSFGMNGSTLRTYQFPQMISAARSKPFRLLRPPRTAQRPMPSAPGPASWRGGAARGGSGLRQDAPARRSAGVDSTRPLNKKGRRAWLSKRRTEPSRHHSWRPSVCKTRSQKRWPKVDRHRTSDRNPG